MQGSADRIQASGPALTHGFRSGFLFFLPTVNEVNEMNEMNQKRMKGDFIVSRWGNFSRTCDAAASTVDPKLLRLGFRILESNFFSSSLLLSRKRLYSLFIQKHLFNETLNLFFSS